MMLSSADILSLASAVPNAKFTPGFEAAQGKVCYLTAINLITPCTPESHQTKEKAGHPVLAMNPASL